MGRNTVDDRLEAAESRLRALKERVQQTEDDLRRLRDERERAAERDDPLATIHLAGYGRYLPTTVAKAASCAITAYPWSSHLDRPTQLLWERVSRLMKDDDLEVVVGKEHRSDFFADARSVVCEDHPLFDGADGPHVLVVRPRSTGSGS